MVVKLIRCMVNSTQHGYDEQQQRLVCHHAKRAWKYTKVKHTAPTVMRHTHHPVFIRNPAFIHDLVFIRDPMFITLTCTETPPVIKRDSPEAYTKLATILDNLVLYEHLYY